MAATFDQSTRLSHDDAQLAFHQDRLSLSLSIPHSSGETHPDPVSPSTPDHPGHTINCHPEDTDNREAPPENREQEGSQGQPRPGPPGACSEAITSSSEDGDAVNVPPAAKKQYSPPAVPPSQTQSQYYHSLQCWKWEMASIWLAIGLLIAVVVIITQYDTKRIDDWQFPINLATLLALIATLLRIVVLVPLTSIISHSKWNLNGEVHRLKDYQDMDMASRGPWGAISALPLLSKCNIPALIAVVASLSTLATAPFVQQAMGTVTCDYETNGLATIPYAHSVPNTHNSQSYLVGDNGDDLISIDVSSMIVSCESDPDPSAAQHRIQVGCASGNCTFPDGDPTEDGGISHSTISFCRRCVDTSSLFEVKGNRSAAGNYTAFLPNGDWMDTNDTTSAIKGIAHSDLSWAGSLMDTPELRRLYDASVSNLTTMAVGSDRTLTAATCILYTCLRSYKTSIQEGELIEQELPTRPTSHDYATLWNFTFPLQDETFETRLLRHSAVVKTPCLADGVAYTERNISTAPNATQLTFCEVPDDGGPCQMRNVSAPEPCIYRTHALFTLVLHNLIESSLQQNCTTGAQCVMFSSTKIWIQLLGESVQGLRGSYPASRADPPRFFQKIEELYQNFSLAVSAHFRLDYGAPSFLLGPTGWPAPDQELGRVTGRAMQTTSCYAAQVQWLALPAALLVLTAALLACVIAKSWESRARKPVWKETLLPLVLYRDRLLPDAGGSAPAAGERRPLMEESQMARLAATMPACFQWTEEPAREKDSQRGTAEQTDSDSLSLQGTRQAGVRA